MPSAFVRTWLRVRILLIAFILLLGAAPVARAVEAVALERGTAITDPAMLRELDGGRFRLDRMLLPERSADARLSNDELFRLPSMMPIRQAIDGEFERYVVRHKASLPKETIGIGEGFDFQLFDRALLYSAQTRFVLAGIVNRMDRAYVFPTGCGEIRLIYRLTRLDLPDVGNNTSSPRLPMTLNLVLKAKADRSGPEVTCSSIANRWLAAGALLNEKLQTKDSPLDLLGPENIDRIETNLQIAHAPKSAVRDFRTDYLLKVFRYDRQSSVFGKPDRPRAHRGRRQPEARVPGMAARSRQSRRVRPWHRADPGKVSRQRCGCADAGRIRSIGFAAGIRPRARRGRRVQRG